MHIYDSALKVLAGISGWLLVITAVLLVIKRKRWLAFLVALLAAIVTGLRYYVGDPIWLIALFALVTGLALGLGLLFPKEETSAQPRAPFEWPTPR